ELFYDLIFVAGIIQLGNALSANVSVGGFFGFLGLFAPLWLMWTSFTFFSNRFEVDDLTHRLSVFLQMFAVGGMAITVQRVLEGGDHTAFALSYAGGRSVLAVMYLRAKKHVPEAVGLARRYSLLFAVDAALWFASAALPPPWCYALWAAGCGVELSIPMSRHNRELTARHPADVIHMSERYGLLVIIVLGESFVKVLSDLAARPVTADVYLLGAMALLITCSLWWIYFDDVAGSRIRRSPGAPFIWIYTHLPMSAAVTAVGVGIKKALAFAPGEVGLEKYRWLLCGALSLGLLAVGLIDSVTERREAELSDRSRVQVRVASAAIVLLLAPAGGAMPAWVFVLLVTLFCVAQVVFDLMMAPMSELHHEHPEDQQIFDDLAAARRRDPSAAAAAPPTTRTATRPGSPSQTVRRGTPNELRRDLYFYLMEGSWTRVFAVLLTVYLAVNVVFACLYMLDPAAVSNLDSGSFIEAFAFSVQTISTVGYGAMSPVGDFAHLIVTIESATGILFVALATGLMFAKASRPRASVLFSERVVVTRRHGKQTLMFRVGNARGNEIVEATMRVSILKDDVSPEGHRMRTLYDVPLRRDNSPLFTLSWSVLHEIDEASAFHGATADNIGERIVFMVCTLMGYDSTYAQTVHARHVYRPEDFRFGERFVDVISQLDDGRMLIDYTGFHTTERDPDVAEGPAGVEVG
ncbi:MAG: low temperature requirement protein A, partial [Myxococcales bacterium]|nr:low temperature requirement protein A [Myxococcales bacterium]